MHDESYDDENDEYYNDNYQDDEYDNTDINKLYFKFDLGFGSIPNWFQKILNNITINTVDDFPFVSLPVNSYFPNTDNGFSSILYLGNNYQNEQIWKTKYFIKNEIEIEYKNHIKNNAAHFVSQPSYYKGMFDMLN